MFDAFFYINYGGKGLRLAMSSEELSEEQAKNLSPVEDCALIIVPHGTYTLEQARALFTKED